MEERDEAAPLRADPRGGEPSAVPGLSVAELAEIAENLRWFSRLSTSQKLALAAAHRARVRALFPEGVPDAG